MIKSHLFFVFCLCFCCFLLVLAQFVVFPLNFFLISFVLGLFLSSLFQRSSIYFYVRTHTHYGTDQAENRAKVDQVLDDVEAGQDPEWFSPYIGDAITSVTHLAAAQQVCMPFHLTAYWYPENDCYTARCFLSSS